MIFYGFIMQTCFLALQLTSYRFKNTSIDVSMWKPLLYAEAGAKLRVIFEVMSFQLRKVWFDSIYKSILGTACCQSTSECGPFLP